MDEPNPPAPDAAVPAVPAAPPPAAPAKPARDVLKSSDLYLILGALALALFVGAFVIHFFDRWRRRPADAGDGPLTLSDYREMYEDGEITQSEYEKIRGKLAAKLKGKAGGEDLDTDGDDGDVGRGGTPPQPDPRA